MAGLKQIDYLITTHFHLDHFGGAAQLAQLMPIKVVYDRGIPEQSPDRNRNDARYPLLIKPYREMEVEERLIIQPGMQLPLKQTFGTAGVALTCVGADQVFVEKPLMAGSSVCDASVPSKPCIRCIRICGRI
jgi:glyoxylase-like metal-dependent hydrolase (beta-lactamase superfamily II)